MRTVTYDENVLALVPKVPTEEMHAAAVRTIVRCHGNDDFPPRVLAAMIAAAPDHPATAGDAEDAEQREFYAIGRAVTRAALELPPRAELRIYLERGAGTVYWLDVEHGALRHIEGGDLFSTQIEAAIEAMRASKGGE